MRKYFEFPNKFRSVKVSAEPLTDGAMGCTNASSKHLATWPDKMRGASHPRAAAVPANGAAATGAWAPGKRAQKTLLRSRKD